MSRTMQTSKETPTEGTGGTPIWVWIVYALGILAATVFVLSMLFTAGAYLLSDDVPVTMNVSVPALVLWGGLAAIAAGVWVYRRRR